MKSIYEEVLEEVSEQNKAWGKSLRAIVPAKLDMISNAIKEAKKQEKLLNKIKAIINRPNDSYIASMLEYSNRYIEIYDLIKELEE